MSLKLANQLNQMYYDVKINKNETAGLYVNSNNKAGSLEASVFTKKIQVTGEIFKGKPREGLRFY